MSADDQPQPPAGGNSSQADIDHITNGEDVIVCVDAPSVNAVVLLEEDAATADVDNAMKQTWRGLEDTLDDWDSITRQPTGGSNGD